MGSFQVRRAKRQRTISHMQHTDSSIRASVTIMVITVAFIIAYGPYICIWIFNLLVFELGLFKGYLILKGNWLIYNYIYFLTTNIMSTINSCIFPIIYFLRVKRTRILGSIKAFLHTSIRTSVNDDHYQYIKLNLMRQHHSV